MLEDAEIGPTVETCVASRLINGGQSCIAAKRFIVVRPLETAFTERMVELMRERTQGNPLTEPGTDLGPLARRDLRDQLHAQVTHLSSAAPARSAATVPPGAGAFYPPTVLTSVVSRHARVRRGDLRPRGGRDHGAEDDADAIRIANDSPFGLGAAVFTKDRARGERIAAKNSRRASAS